VYAGELSESTSVEMGEAKKVASSMVELIGSAPSTAFRGSPPTLMTDLRPPSSSLS
jgi:hypothetical protein